LIIVVTKMDFVLAEDEKCTEENMLSEIQMHYKKFAIFSDTNSLNDKIVLVSGKWAFYGRCYQNKVDDPEYKKYIATQQIIYKEICECPIEDLPDLLVEKSNVENLEKR